MDLDGNLIDELFAALGAHLAASGVRVAVVVVGGASLAATGLVPRTTKDVDVIAKADREADRVSLHPATPLPAGFDEAVQRVARDYGLPADWLNTVIESQWKAGLPPHLEDDLHWREYATLSVGFVGRRSLIPLKFFAAVDQGMRSKHWQDLLKLEPSTAEVEDAARWVRGQDAGSEFQQFVEDARDRLYQALESRKGSV